MSSMATDTMTAQAWADKYGVELDWSAEGFHADESGWEHQRFTVTLNRDGASVSFPWRQGTGITEEPLLDRVLPAIRSDAEAGRLGFEEFVDDFGYDDAKTAYKTWQACQELSKKLYDFMSSEAMWEDFLWIEED